MSAAYLDQTLEPEIRAQALLEEMSLEEKAAQLTGVFPFDENYKVSDTKNHFVVNDISQLADMEEPLYICGGASIYKLFMQKMSPEIIVDSCYMGEIASDLEGKPVDITECIEKMNKKYVQISPDYDEDNIITTIRIKKGEFIPQEILKHITFAIINH